MKRILAMILIFIISSNLNIMASEISMTDTANISISPMYVAVSEFGNAFEIQTGGKTVYMSNLKSTVTNDVRLYGYVQQLKNGNWVTLNAVSNLSTVGRASLSGYYYVPQGYDYRYKVFGYAYSNGKLIESVTWISTVKRY